MAAGAVAGWLAAVAVAVREPPLCGSTAFEVPIRVPLDDSKPGNFETKRFCVCPPDFACQNCTRICKNVWPRGRNPIRCVTGFSPESLGLHNSSCRGEGVSTPDRRSRSGRIERRGGILLRPSTKCGLGEAGAAADQLASRRQEWLPSLDTQFAFTISNGHAATAFLGDAATWPSVVGHPMPRSVRVSFEHYPDNLAVRQLPQHSNFCGIGRFYLRQRWWRGGTQSMVARHPETKLWFDSGHQASLFMFALADLLGARRVRFLRVRRNRLDLAYSKWVSVTNGGTKSPEFSEEDDVSLGPCAADCAWCFCPIDAASVCVPLGSVWARLNPFQKFLWEVDEIECQWQKLVNDASPRFRTLEVNWTDSFAREDLLKIALFINVTTPEAAAAVASTAPENSQSQSTIFKHKRKNEHVDRAGRAAKNITHLLELDYEYRQLLKPRQCDVYVCTW